jgi:SsrA-binding protein
MQQEELCSSAPVRAPLLSLRIHQRMAKQKPAADGEKIVCRNRKARHEYNIVDTLECGIALVGSEVKSLRNGTASIDEAYARLEDGEVWLVGADIPIYPQANRQNHEPKRRRKLLLHRREIERFAGRATQRGFTLVPLKLYFRRGRAKLELAVARGKKIYDKRESMRKRDASREIQRTLRRNR